MGKERTVTNTETRVETQQTQQSQQQQQTRVEPTPEERELQQLEVARTRAVQPGLIGTQQAGLSLVEQLLRGQEPLPGYFDKLSRGISPEVTSDIANQAIADIQPYFNQAGLLNSGVNAVASARVAGDIRRASEEYNIGNRLNLLNLALSGQAQVQQPVLYQQSLLGQRLAGLRPITQTGTFSGTSSGTQSGSSSQVLLGMNPFLKSFETSLGKTLGSPKVDFGPFSFGG